MMSISIIYLYSSIILAFCFLIVQGYDEDDISDDYYDDIGLRELRRSGRGGRSSRSSRSYSSSTYVHVYAGGGYYNSGYTNYNKSCTYTETYSEWKCDDSGATVWVFIILFLVGFCCLVYCIYKCTKKYKNYHWKQKNIKPWTPARNNEIDRDQWQRNEDARARNREYLA